MDNGSDSGGDVSVEREYNFNRSPTLLSSFWDAGRVSTSCWHHRGIGKRQGLCGAAPKVRMILSRLTLGAASLENIFQML
mmetsp:Transcript_69105/g.126872  ORF Transcript_69105/g.126872 Transcript_69105/m.126872 type:complete len:80 (+) Transcript_69105:1049-1288(+)